MHLYSHVIDISYKAQHEDVRTISNHKIFTENSLEESHYKSFENFQSLPAKLNLDKSKMKRSLSQPMQESKLDRTLWNLQHSSSNNTIHSCRQVNDYQTCSECDECSSTLTFSTSMHLTLKTQDYLPMCVKCTQCNSMECSINISNSRINTLTYICEERQVFFLIK